MGDIVNAIELNADENCTRHRLFCFHGPRISTKARKIIGALAVDGVTLLAGDIFATPA